MPGIDFCKCVQPQKYFNNEIVQIDMIQETYHALFEEDFELLHNEPFH